MHLRVFFKKLSVIMFVLCCIMFILGCGVSSYLPSDYIINNTNKNIDSPLTGVYFAKFYKEDTITADNNLNNKSNNYKAKIMLGNVIPIKEVTVKVEDKIMVIPCGTTFGVKIFTEGVMVVKMDEIVIDGNNLSPGKDAGILVGDVITSINNIKVKTNEDVISIVEKSKGKELPLKVKRNNKILNLKIKPIKTDENKSYKIGIWVRDSSAGIGTVTFYQEESKGFAGLGHGVCDVDTGELLPLAQGDIVSTALDSITKATKGSPGSLNGHFNSRDSIGYLLSNKETGVVGVMDESPSEKDSIPLGLKQEVKVGNAKILSTIDNDKPQYFDIEIESINYDKNSMTKNMIIKITDKKLISKTGGIVQGMSGSPIIQDNKLVGAVTHVFVNEPTKGYGIFAENMLKNFNEEMNILHNKAA